MFYEKKLIKGHEYWYLTERYREGKRVRRRHIAYIGKAKPTLSPESYVQKNKLGTTPSRSIIKQEYKKLARENYATGGVVEIPILRNRVQRRTKVSREAFDKELIEMGKEGEFDLKFHFQPTHKEVKEGILREKGLQYYVFDRNVELGTTPIKSKTKGDRTGEWLSMHPLEVERELDKYSVKEMKDASAFILKKGDRRLRNKEQMKQRILKRMSAYASRFEYGADEPSSPWVKKTKLGTT